MLMPLLQVTTTCLNRNFGHFCRCCRVRISNELLIIHDETILVITFATFSALIAKFVAPLYTEWADGEVKKVNDLLNESRNKHVSAVKGRAVERRFSHN